jgi:hypothetical protein
MASMDELFDTAMYAVILPTLLIFKYCGKAPVKVVAVSS